jgi:hypothetical protein
MWKSPRVEMYNEGKADEARQLELDYVEEARCTTLVQSARYLQGIRQYHDCNVREQSFSIGDLVLCRIQDESGLHKHNSRWEGPFVVKQITRTWNTPRVKTSQILGMFRTCASFTHKDDVQGQLFSKRLDVFLPNSIWRLCATEFEM